MKTITLNIKGIHCGCCVKSLTQVLTELDGVQSSIKQLTRSKNENYHIKHKRHTLRLLRKKSYSSFN
ncbi:heavy-metal-associated domain-containing protein [Haemophilus influenzae]|uniref:heavy-metal-associated domain-containing protein n=1 Tax=Haemophilus influenzae TaxID=727 RepID=UPI0010A44A20|nr:heavy-metal-associated domain-containing protein [Haemophilus influenzae]